MSISKRLFPALATGFMAIVLTACGGGSSDTSGGQGVTPTGPTITSQPGSQSVATGETATFKVVATGNGTLSYQWKKNGTNITGATSSSYTTPAVSSADNGAQYSVSISNAEGQVTSNTATLTVSGAAVAPTISSQPAAQSVTEGQSATFSVTASGTSLQYQWKKNGTDISGATSSTYTMPTAVAADNHAVFTVVVSNTLGAVTSSNAILTVSPVDVAPAITTQPAAQTVFAGQSATFSVTASGTSLKYQWKKNGTDIPGATASSYTTEATSNADIGAALAYSVVVSNSAGSVTSSNATLTVTAATPALTAQPAAQITTAGSAATFTVKATGTAPLGYQWKKNGTDISGATSSTYTTPATGIGDNNAVFTVVVTNSAGNATSSSATLTVNISSATGYSQIANGSGGTYAKEECVLDNSTGLIWEGKTASPATSRLGTSTYTNFDSTSTGQKTDGSNPIQAEINASTNSIGYVNSVNASGLCGYTDWRLPTKEELYGIVVSGPSPTINTTWFPNTQAYFYWTSSPYVGNFTYAYYADFNFGYTSFGIVRNTPFHVRLVR